MEVIISEKVGKRPQETLSFFKSLILKEVKNLLVEIKEVTEKNGFIKLIFEGEDSEVFLNIIKNSFNVAPKSINDLKANPIFKAFVSSIEKNKIYLDAGIILNSDFKIYIPIETLWSQLTYGKKEDIKTILTQYCLFKDFPVEARVIYVSKNEAEAAFSDKQLQFFWELQSFPFERIVIADTLINEVKKAVILANVKKGIAEIKSLSLLIHLLTCKLAVSSGDLALKLQKYLPTARIINFVPKNIKMDC
ncbi:MAG: DUF2110 family protein [Candidatus Bathyarchaeia archaeon]|nr:DUF2110 family protein [Candidatus Bathyarchaeota archaeon]